MPVQQRICPICEAACNLDVVVTQNIITSCRGHQADTFSKGHICPKGVALGQLHHDPDRLRQPMIRGADGHLETASWADAFACIAEGLTKVRTQHGLDSVATYIGNPTAHNVGMTFGVATLASALQSKNLFSAGSVDQLPKQLACELMYGNGMAISVPDIERTQYLMMIGANPLVSNGSLWVVPGIRQKIQALQARGGRLIVIDPRRTETAELADDHHFIRPGTDAWLLAALAKQLLALGCQPRCSSFGLAAFEEALGPISIDQAADHTGISSTTIRELANQLSSADSAAVYGRVGTTLQEFGTLSSFLIELVNVLTGNLDQPGGVMFPQQAYAGPPTPNGPPNYARYRSRVSGYPEVLGQMPVACLAEEMETPGEGQIRALITLAGNPVVSNPESDRLSKALAKLDFMVAVDLYHNETTRHAHVILPGTSPFEECHYDSFLGAMTYRNTARYSPALLPPADRPNEFQILQQLTYLVTYGQAAQPNEMATFQDQLLQQTLHAYNAEQDTSAMSAMLANHIGVDQLLDLGIRLGPWGSGWQGNDGLTLQHLVDNPSSIDMGALTPRLNQVLKNVEQQVNLAPGPIVDDLARLINNPKKLGLRLIGRRNIQTNNSWLHNLPLLSKGPDRAYLEMNSADAKARNINDGDLVLLKSSIGQLQVRVVTTAKLMKGIVCLPHGFSTEDKPQQQVARQGVNSNSIAPANFVDQLSATVALNGIPVDVARLPPAPGG